MRRVSSALPFGVTPATLTAALVVAFGWVGLALFVAHHITALEQPLRSLPTIAAPDKPDKSEPSQRSNSAAKAAREPMRQAALAPDPRPLRGHLRMTLRGSALRAKHLRMRLRGSALCAKNLGRRRSPLRGGLKMSLQVPRHGPSTSG